MANPRNYKELIFTDHALARLRQRQVSMSEAWAAWRRPNKKYFATTKQAWVFQRNWGHRQVEVVAKQNDHKQWVAISVWSNYVAYRKPKSFWKTIFTKILSLLKGENPAKGG